MQDRSDYAIVGAQLSLFLDRWSALISDQWVLSVIRWGYQIPFPGPPPLDCFLVTPLSRDYVRQSAMLSGVAMLLQKEAILPVPVEEVGLGFYSHLFRVQKPDDSFRPILNLRALNKLERLDHFWMVTLQSVIPLIQEGVFFFFFGFSGLGRRLFSLSCPSCQSTVPEVCGPRDAFPVSGSAVWPLHCSQEFYQGIGSCCGDFAASGFLHVSLY